MRRPFHKLLFFLTVMSVLGCQPAAAQPDERFGLIFVYSASCPFSRSVSPALKQIATRYNLPVLPISMDGYRLTDWPETRPDNGRSQHLSITRVPFIALYDNESGALRPVANRAFKPAQLHTLIINAIRGTP